MLGLSVEMTILYRKSARSMSTSSSVTINFNLTFGHRMESFISHKDRIAELMWTWQLENSAEISGKCKYACFGFCWLCRFALSGGARWNAVSGWRLEDMRLLSQPRREPPPASPCITPATPIPYPICILG